MTAITRGRIKEALVSIQHGIETLAVIRDEQQDSFDEKSEAAQDSDVGQKQLELIAWLTNAIYTIEAEQSALIDL